MPSSFASTRHRRARFDSRLMQSSIPLITIDEFRAGEGTVPLAAQEYVSAGGH